MEWQEFREQAARDLLSCKILRKDEDYGNAAYLLQQSLEKYVKAYLFKFELFADDPKNLGHLPLKVLFKKLSEEIDKKIRQSNNPQTKIIFSLCSPLIKETLNLFEKIKDSKNPIWRKAIWKDSLGLPITDEEESIIKQTKSDWDNRLVPELSKGASLFSNNVDELKNQLKDPIKKQIIENKIRHNTGLSPDTAIDILTIVNSDLQNLPTGMPTALEFFEKLLKIIPDVERNNPFQRDFMKLIQGAWVFAFRDEIIMTFTHEDIGRYPTDIDNVSSRTIYAQRSKELDKLIERVEGVCKKIDMMLQN